MGRKKTIEDDVLISLIDEYFLQKCSGNAKALRPPLITAFIKESGYPEYAVETLRRNAKARNHIEQLKESAEENLVNTLVCYNTLDAKDFLTRNPTEKARIAALTHLDAYYRSIAATAVTLNEKSKTVLDNLEKLDTAYRQAQMDISSLTTTVSELKQTIKNLKIENKTLRSIIDTYVYPEVASALVDEKYLTNASEVPKIIDPSKLPNAVITGETKISKDDSSGIQNRIIQGLFERFDL